jgi:hypothetical protein
MRPALAGDGRMTYFIDRRELESFRLSMEPHTGNQLFGTTK